MARLQAIVIAILVGLTVLPAPSQARQDEETRRELAKQLFMQANESAKEGRYREAIKQYDQAIKLAPNVGSLHRNIAVVYKKLGRCDKALVHFDRYLELRPEAPDAEVIDDERRECREILEANPNLGSQAEHDGTLSILCNVEGAAVKVDGVLMGNTPIQPLNLKPGSYNILVTKAGYEPWQRRLPVSAGRDVVVNVTLVVEIIKGPDKPKEDPNLAWKWTTVGVGSALVATGLVFTILAETDRAEFEDTQRDSEGRLLISMPRAQELQDSVNTKRTVSYVMYGLGGAAVIGGVTWMLLDTADETDEGTVTPVSAAPLPGGGMVTFTGSF